MLAEVNASGADTTLIGVWFAAILFMFQIYYDFSGYADMAIGLGRIFGFRYCENFNRPYLALSVTEFTRRWFISLGSFFRDYVYLPLGGKQMGKPRQIFNMFVVWLLVGLWHGAGWNFVLWGLYFFVILVVEKQYKSTLDFMPDWVCRCITLWLVLVGWILFSHESFADLQAAFMAALGYGGMAVPGLGIQILNSLPLMLVCFLGCTTFPIQAKRIFDGVCGMGRRRVKPDLVTPLRAVHLIASLIVMCLLLWLCTLSLVRFSGAAFVFGNI
jgi:alginate O-acetyltransferase complex protein AlgI